MPKSNSLPETSTLPTSIGFFRIMRISAVAVTVLISTLFAALPTWADLTAEVDTLALAEGDSLELTLTLDRLAFRAQPDFSTLQKDFDILGTQQSSQTRIVNNKTNTLTTWTLTLMPKKPGSLEIPAITVAGERSEPITVTVSQQDPRDSQFADKTAFVEATVDNDDVYVGAQVIYTIKLYYRVALDGNLDKPAIKNAIVESLGEPRKAQTLINGIPYYTYEKKFAIFPQTSGELAVPPALFKGKVTTRSGRRYFGQSSTKSVIRRSNALELFVKPAPANFPGDDWLPARNLDISESWSQQPDTFTVGQPVTRMLTITVNGLSANSLPTPPAPQTPSLKAYPDKAILNDTPTAAGIEGQLLQSQALIALKEGALELPEIRINWWNTETDRPETAILPGRTVSIVPAVNAADSLQGTLQGTQPTPLPTTPGNTPPPTTEGHTPAPAHTIDLTPTAPTNAATVNFWKTTTWALAVLWLLTTLYCIWLLTHRQTKKPNQPTPQPVRELHTRDAGKKLKAACQNHNPQAVESALLGWFNTLKPELKPEHQAKNLGDIKNAAQDPGLIQAINKLEAVRYKNVDAICEKQSNTAWRGDDILATYKSLKYADTMPDIDKKNALPPLYPITNG